MYLHYAPVNETLPAKTLSGRLDRMYCAHELDELWDSPVVILVHVREDQLAVLRNDLAKRACSPDSL